MPKATGEPLSLLYYPLSRNPNFQNSPSLDEAHRQNLSHRRRSHRFFQRRRHGGALPRNNNNSPGPPPPRETPRQGDRNRPSRLRRQPRRLQDAVQNQDPGGVSQGDGGGGEEEVPRSEAEAVGEMGGGDQMRPSSQGTPRSSLAWDFRHGGGSCSCL